MLGGLAPLAVCAAPGVLGTVTAFVSRPVTL
jgi:hypothetical protein